MSDSWIIIPCYNEQERLPLEDFYHFFDNSSQDVRILFVNDGSTDDTLRILNSIHEKYPKQCEVLNLAENHGKANAIRNAVLTIASTKTTDYIGYWDADLSTPIEDVNTFLHFLRQRSDVKFLLGSRIRKLGSHIERGAVRHYLGRIFATASSLLLRLPVYDTQCGSKIFKAELAEILFSEEFCSPWFFDVELLARFLCNYGHSQTLNTVCELPLANWKDSGGSKLKLHDFARAPLDLLRIHFRLADKIRKSNF